MFWLFVKRGVHIPLRDTDKEVCLVVFKRFRVCVMFLIITAVLLQNFPKKCKSLIQKFEVKTLRSTFLTVSSYLYSLLEPFSSIHSEELMDDWEYTESFLAPSVVIYKTLKKDMQKDNLLTPLGFEPKLIYLKMLWLWSPKITIKAIPNSQKKCKIAPPKSQNHIRAICLTNNTYNFAKILPEQHNLYTTIECKVPPFCISYHCDILGDLYFALHLVSDSQYCWNEMKHILC